MTDNKRKKNSRQRGSWTHGWGAKKKHRGAGHRGGRGNAGSGKKGDAKKTLFWENPDYFGKRGFVSAKAQKEVTINIAHLDTIADTLMKQGSAKREKDTIIIDLNALGYTKLLGAGKTNKKLIVTVKNASENAEQKIQQAGGKLTLLLKKEE
ncbi:MAG: uL15m family ribosomal protein [Candidatus Woesearchaeota archaeon]|jgi:large subunit ribosomal protein L15